MNGPSFAPGLYLTIARASGWLALAALALTLCVTPLALLAARSNARWLTRAPRLRRQLGMTSAWLALVHAGAATPHVYDAAHGALHRLIDTAHVRAGLSALVVLVALLATSYPALVRALGVRPWKELHRLSYVAFAFALQHALLSPFAPRLWLLALGGSVVAVGLLRLLGARSR